MDQKDVIAELIVRLQHVMKHPAMYMGDVTIASALSFQAGLYCACSAIGMPLTTTLCSRASNSRGWEYGSSGAVQPMREAGLTEEQIVQELLLIEIKMLELVAEGLAD